MRDVLTLDSINMKGGFMLGGVIIEDFEDREYEIELSRILISRFQK
jgi:hypothetical protein